MATKAKTTPASKPAQAASPAAHQPLAEAFSKALSLVDSGKFSEACQALETLMHEAQATGDWAMKRRAQTYFSLAETKAHPAKVAAPDPVSDILACLNRHETDEALKQLEKALKANPGKGVLHYLRAVAFAQAENAEASAENLKKALELDGDLVFQWHMEPDFNAIRKSALFAFTEGR